MTQLHIAEADEDAGRHRAALHRRVNQRAEADFVEIGLHIEQKPASGHIIDLQHIIIER